MALKLLLALLLIVAQGAAAAPLIFDDPQGDQAPFPAYLDLQQMTFSDDGELLTLVMQMGDNAPDFPKTLHQFVFASSTKEHNVGCTSGSSNPLQTNGLSCFGYSSESGQFDYYTDRIHAERDTNNHTITWLIPIEALREPAGETLVLVRAFASLIISVDANGGQEADISQGAQDEAHTDLSYTLPGPSVEDEGASIEPEQTETPAPSGSKGAPGLTPIYLTLALVLLAARKRA